MTSSTSVRTSVTRDREEPSATSAAETIHLRTDAERVIADSRSTVLPPEFFDAFFNLLAPEPTPALVSAAAIHRRTIRRTD